mgnify:CR=1 FL=1
MKDIRTILIILALACLTPRLAAQVQDAEPVDEELLLDTVEALSEDTTFFYEGEDTTEVIMSDADFNDLIEEWTSDDSIMPQWLRKLFDGGWGIVALLLVLVIFLFLFILLLAFCTAPIWIPVLIIVLLLRKSRKKERPITKSDTDGNSGKQSQQNQQQSTDNYNKSEN